MSNFLNSISALSPGLAYVNGNSTVQTSPPNKVGAGVQSQTMGIFACNQLTQIPSNNSKVVQRIYATITNIAKPIPDNPGGSVPYNSSNVLVSATITPTSSISTINIEFATTMMDVIPTGSSVFAAGVAYVYVNGPTNPTPLILSQVNANYVSPGASDSITYPAIGGLSIAADDYTAPITVAICPYNTSSGTVKAGQLGDYLTLTEVLPQVPVTMNPIITVTSNTPVLAFSIPLTASTNTQVYGTFSFFDVNNAISSISNFNMVAQQPTSGSATIAQNTVIVDSIYASPTLTFTPGTNVLNVYVVGSSGQSYQCQFSYNAVVVG